MLCCWCCCCKRSFVKRGARWPKKNQKVRLFCSKTLFWFHHKKPHQKEENGGDFDGLLGVFRERKQPNASGKGTLLVLVLILLNVEHHHRVGGWYARCCVCLRNWWDMKWKISSFSFFPPKWQQKDFSTLLNTTRALLFVSSKNCVVLFSVRDVFLVALFQWYSSFSMHHLTTSQRENVLFTHINFSLFTQKKYQTNKK